MTITKKREGKLTSETSPSPDRDIPTANGWITDYKSIDRNKEKKEIKPHFLPCSIDILPTYSLTFLSHQIYIFCSPFQPSWTATFYCILEPTASQYSMMLLIIQESAWLLAKIFIYPAILIILFEILCFAVGTAYITMSLISSKVSTVRVMVKKVKITWKR